MKNLMKIITLAFCFVMYLNTAICKEISISEAIKTKLIAVQVKSNSGHTGKCLSLSVKNLKNKKLNILIEAGRMFIPSDSAVQNLIVVKHENIELNPNETKTQLITAVCAQKHDSGPRPNLKFTTGNFGKYDAKNFAEWLDTKAYYNNQNSQNAMWIFTDNAAPEFTLADPHDKEMLAFVANAKNLNYENLVKKFTNRYANNYPVPTKRKFVFTSTLNFTLTVPQVLKADLCDRNNQIIKHCIIGDTLSIGANTKKIEFTNDDLDNGKYYLKVYIDGRMITRREIEIN